MDVKCSPAVQLSDLSLRPARLTGVRLHQCTLGCTRCTYDSFVGFLRHNMTAPTARHLHGHSGWLYTSWSRHGDISATRISGHTRTDAQGCVFVRIAAEVGWRGGVHHLCFRTCAPLYQSQLTGDGTPGSAVLAEYYRWEMKQSVEFWRLICCTCAMCRSFSSLGHDKCQPDNFCIYCKLPNVTVVRLLE